MALPDQIGDGDTDSDTQVVANQEGAWLFDAP